jgi:translocation and assembly module TamA
MKKTLIILATLVVGLFICINLNAASTTPAFQYEIRGIKDPLLANVKAYLSQIEKPQHAQQAPDLIRKALQPFGYFKPHIQTSAQDKNNFIYTVDPGPVLRITKINLQATGPGAGDPKLQELLKNFPLKVGLPLETAAYDKAKQLLFNTAEQQGYIAAQFTTHEIAIDRKRYTAIITLQLDTGTRYYFGAIHFSKTPYDENFLRRYLPFKSGDPYSTVQLFNLQNSLSNSGYFQQATVEPVHAQTQQQQVPVAVTVTPIAAQLYKLGIGYGTDTGPRALAGADWRRVTDTGHRFSTQVQVSAVQSVLQALYTIPGDKPATDKYTINGSIIENRLDQGESLTKQLGVAAINTQGDWQRTLALNEQFERFQFTGQAAQSSTLLIPSVTWIYLHADDPIYAHEGQRFSFRVQGSDQALLSSTRFIQGEAQEKYIHSFTEDSRIILRGDVGYTGVQNLQTFPLSLRFYAGGTQSMRGYDYQSIGPGRYLAVASAEYQHKLFGNFSGAIFYDWGNAFDNYPIAPQRSTGVGLVWNSPLGPMELTVAESNGALGHTAKIQFMMGPDFG